MSKGASKEKKWSRKLYIKTDYPDNYVDESFLAAKKINGLFEFTLNQII